MKTEKKRSISQHTRFKPEIYDLLVAYAKGRNFIKNDKANVSKAVQEIVEKYLKENANNG